MRSVNGLAPLLLVSALAAGCATSGATVGVGRTLEMAYDDSHPAQQPILPQGNYELLIKEEPNLPSFRPLRLRLLMAQPGRLVLRLYDSGADGRPGKLLYTIDREYPPELCSSGTDGKWLVENLPELPDAHGPLFVGVGLPDPASQARVWVTDNDSGHVYQRDAEPQTALISSPVHYTPMVRLEIVPK